MRQLGSVLALVAVQATAQVQGVRVEADEPRAFGYQVGDTVERRVTVHAGAGWALDANSLPKAGARGGALELRRVAATAHAEGDGRRHEFDLQYQVFISPPAVRTFEIPAFRLRFNGPQRSEEVRVEAWPVTVAPLVPVEVSPRRGLGELRPDHAPPLIDDRTLRLRLLWIAAAALVALGTLAVIHWGPPWRAARNRPFGRAWRQLRDLPPTAPGAQWRAACKTVHEALNRSAGEVLFESGLERFIAAHPAFTALRDDLARFLRLSRGEFFGEAEREAGDAAWLVGLCRRCCDAERGFAPRRKASAP
jgi:mxaA protein